MYPQNLSQVDDLINFFFKKHEQGIITIHNIYYHTNNKLSIQSLLLELTAELKTGCITFINKQLPIENLDSYLFYIVNAYCKKMAQPALKKKTAYFCPGCLYLGKENIIYLSSKYFKCNECVDGFKNNLDPKKNLLYKTFNQHNKNGYHCFICDRFIPHPLDNSENVSCPYFDCWFVGKISTLKKMHHPTSQSNPEKLILDISKNNGAAFKDLIASDQEDVVSQLETKQELLIKINALKETINSQSNSVPYSSSDFTVKHKCLVYQSFNNLLDKYPVEMTDYLLNDSRSGGFQHKIFQEYIKLLEVSLPFIFKRGNKLYKINSLLDDNLSLFDGISEFDAIVSDKLSIKNNTKEFYIGGRAASYAKPYYIGKLLNIIAKKTKTPIINNVVEYSFNKIKVSGIEPGTEVSVTHLRVPPHYQMGGMVYINRIRKKIIDRTQIIISKVVNA